MMTSCCPAKQGVECGSALGSVYHRAVNKGAERLRQVPCIGQFQQKLPAVIVEKVFGKIEGQACGVAPITFSPIG